MVPSIFYNPEDEADAMIAFSPSGLVVPPAVKRARATISAAVLIQRATLKKNDRARLRRMCEHVMGLRLPPSRLANLWSYTRDDAVMVRQTGIMTAPSVLPSITQGEYMAAAWLVSRACLSLLVDIPLRDDRDAAAFVDIVTASGGMLSPAHQRKAARIAHQYIAARIAGRPFDGGAQ